MLLLNDQLKHHLENWEADPSVAVDNHGIDDDSLVDDTPNHDDSKLAHRQESNVSNCPRNTNMLLTRCWDALILCVGFLLGVHAHDYWNWNWTSVSFWTVAIAVVLGIVSAFVICGNSLRQLQRARRSAVLQAQRVELASLLSRIGAPPPFLSRMKLEVLLVERDNPTEALQDAIDLVKSFTQLLTTIDSSLDRMKSATSMELGLGIWSPAVSRVEHHRPMRTPCALITAKTILAQGLQRGLELFQSQTQMQRQMNGNGELQVPITMDTVVTISSLQVARRDLVLALTHSIWIPRNKKDTKYCVDTMEEIDVYLRASLLEHHADESSSSLHCVAQHMHAAEIALWVYSRETENEVARQEWIQRFHALLKMANTLQETKTTGRTSNMPSDDEQAPAQVLQSEIISSPSNFEDSGNMVGTNRGSSTHVAAPRTLVFSGKGLVPRKRPQSAGITTPSLLAPSTTSGSAIAQAMLFQELQTYLAANANADEVSVNGALDQCEEDVDESAHGDDTSGRQFVIPDRLLAELALSISKDPPRGETIELFCDRPLSPLEENRA